MANWDEPAPPSRRLGTRQDMPAFLGRPGQQPQGWRRAGFLLAPYVMLVLGAVVTLFIDQPVTRSAVVTLALCGLAAVWTLWLVTLHPAWWQRPRLMAVFVAGMIIINAALVLLAPWFGFFVPVTYMFSFALLRWPWRLAGVSAVAVTAATAQTSDADKATAAGLLIYVAAIAINALPLNGLAWFLHNSENWHQLRQQTIEELREANSKLAATLAENAGLHQQLLTQAREAGILDERQRMAREIHDTLAQGLTGIVTQLQAAEQAGPRDPHGPAPGEWRRHIQAATQLARDSLGEARRSVQALRPEALETARLTDALAEVAGRWSALHQTKAEVTTTGTVRPLPADTDVALLRTAQEALANVAKHARAGRVGLTLSYMDHQVALDVRDDGQGFDTGLLRAPAPAAGTAAVGTGAAGPGAASAGTEAGTAAVATADVGAASPAGRADGGGFGLLAMRQRIEALHGTLQVESEPGAGTAISACVPAPPAGAPA